MKKILLFITLTAYLFSHTLQDAKNLYKDKQYKEAISIFQAYTDEPESEYYLGRSYLYGTGVKKDFDKAFEYAKRSAEGGSASGINLLGVLYIDGLGVEKDELQSLALYKKAAQKGNVLAMLNIGKLYELGNVVKKDLEKARSWYEKVVEKGDFRGYSFIADMYFLVKEDERALKYYLLFKEKTGNDSVWINENIGYLYYLTKEYTSAYPYLLKAAQQGSFLHTYNLLEIVTKEAKLKNKIDKVLTLLERATNSNFNKTDSLFITQQALYRYYYFQAHQIQKGIELAQNAYINGNFEIGCDLAQYYGSYLLPGYKKNRDINFSKAFSIATEIIDKYPDNKYISSCYSTLSSLYLFGVYRPKNIHKSIAILEKAYQKFPHLRLLLSQQIGGYYLKQLEDFENAEKWYKKAYELTKDEKYLHMVSNYKENLPKFDDYNATDPSQQVFPVLDNFNSPQQVISIIETEKYYFIATDQKAIYMYDKYTFRRIKELRMWAGQGARGMIANMTYNEKTNILYVAPLYSDKNLSQNDKILALDVEQNKVIKVIQNDKSFKVTSLAISEDDTYLLAVNRMEEFNIINKDTNKTQRYERFLPESKLLAGKIVKKDDDYIAYIIDSTKTLWQYSVKKERKIAQEAYSDQVIFSRFNPNTPQAKQAKKLLSISHHNMFTKVLLKDNRLFLSEYNSSKVRSFNLKTLKFARTNQNIDFTRPVVSSLEVKYTNDHTSIEVYEKKSKKLLSTLDFLWSKPVRHVIIDNKYILVATNDLTQILVFDLNGKAIASLSGVKALQNNLMYYKDGYLFTSGTDKVVHIWDLSILHSIKKTKNDVYDREVLSGFNKMTKVNPLEMLTETLDKKLLEQQAKVNNLSYIPTEKQFKFLMRMVFLKKKQIEPLVSLYVKDDDWILYNSQGLFTSSDKGKDLIKYHLNQGLYKEAKIIKNSQIYDTFYRPDLMKKILAKEDVNTTIDIRAIILNIQPPEVSIVSNVLHDKKDLTLTYKVCDKGNGVANTSILLNGIAANPQNSRGFVLKKKITPKDSCNVYQNIITLKPGKNTIAIKAFDKEKIISSTSDTVSVDANYTLIKKPNLHFVSLAVSDYENNSFDLKYPVSDVLAVEKKIKEKGATLFENIYTYKLHDNNMTKASLSMLFDKISKGISINDVFVLYIAGHGVSDEGIYYFLPYNIKDSSVKSLKKYGVSVYDIKDALAKISAHRSLIMLDTCNSGAILDTLEVETAVNRLEQDNKRNYIAASSKKQVALEGYKGHGIFTYVVLDAFRKASLIDQDITVSFLKNILNKDVSKITQKAFHYEQTPVFNIVEDFAIGTNE